MKQPQTTRQVQNKIKCKRFWIRFIDICTTWRRRVFTRDTCREKTFKNGIVSESGGGVWGAGCGVIYIFVPHSRPSRMWCDEAAAAEPKQCKILSLKNPSGNWCCVEWWSRRKRKEEEEERGGIGRTEEEETGGRGRRGGGKGRRQKERGGKERKRRWRRRSKRIGGEESGAGKAGYTVSKYYRLNIGLFKCPCLQTFYRYIAANT